MVTHIREFQAGQSAQAVELTFDLASILIEEDAVALDYIVSGKPTHIDFAVVEKR